MRILCDIDGVVCQYDYPMLTKKFYGVPIPNKGIYTYSIEDSLGVPKESVVAMFKEACHYPPNFIKGAVNTLQYFLNEGHEVDIYTNRLHFMTFENLDMWLRKYKVPFTSIVGTVDKEYSFQIDDSPTKLIATNGQVKRRLLFHSPWNKQCLNVTGKLERVKSWKQIKEIVDEEQDNLEWATT